MRNDRYVESRFTYKGYRCVVLMQAMGFRCGYVEVPKGHPLFNQPGADGQIRCHGGITYSGTNLGGLFRDGSRWDWL